MVKDLQYASGVVSCWLKLPLPFLSMSASVERNVTLQNFSNVLENSEEK